MTDIQTDVPTDVLTYVPTDVLTDVLTDRHRMSTNINKRVENEEFRVCDRPMMSETNVFQVYMDQWCHSHGVGVLASGFWHCGVGICRISRRDFADVVLGSSASSCRDILECLSGISLIFDPHRGWGVRTSSVLVRTNHQGQQNPEIASVGNGILPSIRRNLAVVDPSESRRWSVGISPEVSSGISSSGLGNFVAKLWRILMFWLETWWIYSFCWVGWISQSTFPGLRRRWVTHPPWDILPLRWPPRELGPANRRTPKAPWLLPCLDCPSQQTTDLQLFTSINKTTFATRLLLKTVRNY